MSHNYPDEHDLDVIREWECKTADDLHNLFIYIESRWWMPDWGWWQFTDGKGQTFFHVATGGWSGNEDLIAALQDNFIAWHLCFEALHRGGHYIFRIPADYGKSKEETPDAR